MEQLNFNTLISDLNKVRSAIDSLQEERAWLETAPANKADLVKNFNARVDKISSESGVIRRLFANMDPFSAVVRTGSEHHQQVDLAPVLCDLFSDIIKATVGKKIEALDYTAGPPIEERPKLLEINTAQLKELEIAEENLIVEGEKVGITVSRRPDVDPAIFLETHLDWPKAPSAPPPAYVDEQRKLEQMVAASDRANTR